MAHATPGLEPSPGDPLTMRAFTTFFAVLGLLIDQGVTVVAEAAFQDQRWRPALEDFVGRADVRVVNCTVDADTARERMLGRREGSARSAHTDAEWLSRHGAGEQDQAAFVPSWLDVPILQVDTTNGYRPGLNDIVTFIRG